MIYFLNPVKHPNIGDIALFYASCEFLKFHKLDFKILNADNYKSITPSSDDKLLVLGGGWLGIYCDACTDFYIKTIKEWSAICKVIFMPNSFVPVKNYYKEIADCKLTIFARDDESLTNYKMNFKNSDIHYSPDIVFFLRRVDLKPGAGIAAICRNDLESTNEISSIKCDKTFGRFTPTPINYSIKPDEYDKVIDTIYRQIFEIGKFSVIVTDTLHMSIFAYLAKRPCIYFDTKYGKIKNTWHRYGKTTCVAYDKLKNTDISKYDISYDDCYFDYSQLLHALKE